MFARIFNLRTIELTFMNEMPIPAREAGRALFRDYLLDELVTMRLEGLDPALEERFNLSPDIWRRTLNYVILTKLSTFSINPFLEYKHLVRLRQIAILTFGEENTSMATLIQKAQDRGATILEDWLKQLNAALKKHKPD
ncbi:hypothetical protein [Hydrogenovibrio marinus]|uniref:Uncharacterized protein n=1 Tax=Hydrogenovibrio marinus TaxID=28885 RepID=A0A066ZRX9_HYDMR|nr:hypothetical protein [Hydrogenovibrio marinus]KDN96217.1 hypothetical protein EI16_08000 [Hydrogenovibrio marinus]BBN60605.1 hypothetical protein HVMH_2199 [Hydrogenovibrio marinus]